MTDSLTRYKRYQEYLDDESLAPNGNYRLLDSGELIELPEDDDSHRRIALRLLILLFQLEGGIYTERVRNGNREIQVNPVGDKWINRKPDLMVLRPEHLEDSSWKAISLGSVPPLFVAEVVSPGSESSDNYKRDYVWKRQQYQEMKIPEYWIIDPHREQVTALTLVSGKYESVVYEASEQIDSQVFPMLSVTVERLLRGES